MVKANARLWRKEKEFLWVPNKNSTMRASKNSL